MTMKAAVSLSVAMLLPGCVSFTASRYAPSADNVDALRPLAATPVSVGQIGAGNGNMNHVRCRGARLTTTDGESFPQFVQKALRDELRMAGGYAQTSPVTLNGTLDRLELNVASGRWTLGLSLHSSNGQSTSAEEEFEYNTTVLGLGREGCEHAAQALNPAVQNLIGKLVRSPRFAALVKP